MQWHKTKFSIVMGDSDAKVRTQNVSEIGTGNLGKTAKNERSTR